MSSRPLPDVPNPDSADDEREWLVKAAFVFVVLALVALAVLPSVLLRRITATAAENTTTILPANDALGDLAFAMEERIAVSRGRFLTNDPRYDRRLVEAKRAEDDALQALTELAPRLGPRTRRHFESLRAHMLRRDSIEAELVRGGEEIGAYQAALPAFDEIRDAMLAELTGFRQELMQAADARAAAEARWARLQRLLSYSLGTIALLAAFLVGWFALRQQRLRRELQRALEEENQQRAIAERRKGELEQAIEARVRLLRGVTHDVKNPLGAARGYAELLDMGVKAPLVPEQEPLVKGVIRSIDGALAILGDLLDLARADSGGLVMSRRELDLRDVAKEAAEVHRPAAEAAGHVVEVEQAEEALRLYTDPVRVGQVLGNLLSNAIKYTPPPGRIVVRTGVRNQDSGAQVAAVEVWDTGRGIPPDQREAIFNEFTRLDDRSPHQGHGLGLAIARRIARLLGGDLTVEEAPTGGANFVLWLPEREDAAASGGSARKPEAGALS